MQIITHVAPFISDLANEIDNKSGRESLITTIKENYAVREMLAMSYLATKGEIERLGNIPEDEKQRLWKLSKGCKQREKFCQALWYFENIK